MLSLFSAHILKPFPLSFLPLDYSNTNMIGFVSPKWGTLQEKRRANYVTTYLDAYRSVSSTVVKSGCFYDLLHNRFDCYIEADCGAGSWPGALSTTGEVVRLLARNPDRDISQ